MKEVNRKHLHLIDSSTCLLIGVILPGRPQFSVVSLTIFQKVDNYDLETVSNIPLKPKDLLQKEPKISPRLKAQFFGLVLAAIKLLI